MQINFLKKTLFFLDNFLFNSITIQLLLSSDPLSLAVSTIILAILLKLFLFSFTIFETSSNFKASQTPS